MGRRDATRPNARHVSITLAGSQPSPMQAYMIMMIIMIQVIVIVILVIIVMIVMIVLVSIRPTP